MPKSSTKKSERQIEELSYEEALTELEAILSSMEEGQSSLEESMNLFERGQALVARCGALLESAQLKVHKLSGESLILFEEETE